MIWIICMVCMLLLSCSVGKEAKLCHVRFSQDSQSKSLSMSIGQSCNVTFCFYVSIPEDKAPADAYASIDYDHWYTVDELTDVILSQGEWTFDAVAVDATIANGLTQETIASAALLKGSSVEDVNLYTSVITIPLNEYGEGDGTVNLVYELADENGNKDTLNITPSVLYAMDGSSAGTLNAGDNTIPAGKYHFNVIVKSNSDPNTVVFSDLVVFSVYPGFTTKVFGKYQMKRPAIDISGETNSDPNSPTITGLKDVLDWAGKVNDDTVSVIIKDKDGDKTIPITNPTDPSVPVFPIPDCVTEVDIDMNGNKFEVRNGGSDLTTLFHLDSGVTLTFNNSQSSQSNVIVGNKGSAITMDGGTLNLNGTSVAPANGNKLPAVNLVGCANSLGSNNGATINLLQKSYLENCSYGIANIDPSTTKPSTINGNVSILVADNSTISGSSYGISLVDVNGNVDIKVDGTGSKISGGINLKNVTGDVTITVTNGGAITGGLFLGEIHGNVTVKLDRGSLSGGQYGLKISSMDSKTTLQVELYNNSTMTGTSSAVDNSVIRNITMTKKVIYDSTCRTLATGTAFSSKTYGWTQTQI